MNSESVATVGQIGQPDVRHHLMIIIALNIVIRCVWLLYVHPHQLFDFQWYYVHAVQLLNGQGYRANHHYTAYWPIGYPYFLSLLFRVTGPSVTAGLIANAVLSIGIVILVYLLTLTLSDNHRLALLSAIGYTLLPSQIEWNSVLGSEELFTALLLLSLYLYALSRKRGGWLLTLVAGLCLGLSCDIRPVPLLFPVVIGLLERWIQRRTVRSATITVLLLFAGAALGVCPVTIRNLIALHHFVPISTNGGVDFWQGTQVDGSYYWSWNARTNPLLAAGNNEVLENSIGTHTFIQHVIHHPFWTVVHALIKWFFLYWVDWNVISVTIQVFTKVPVRTLVSFAMWFNTVVYWAWMLVCALGLWKGVRIVLSSWHVIALPIAYIVYNTAVFGVFPAWDRFRYPMMPLFAVCFGLGVYTLISRMAQRTTDTHLSAPSMVRNT